MGTTAVCPIELSAAGAEPLPYLLAAMSGDIAILASGVIRHLFRVTFVTYPAPIAPYMLAV